MCISSGRLHPAPCLTDCWILHCTFLKFKRGLNSINPGSQPPQAVQDFPSCPGARRPIAPQEYNFFLELCTGQTSAENTGKSWRTVLYITSWWGSFLQEKMETCLLIRIALQKWKLLPYLERV
jgi:hypothetical protein